MRFDGLDEMEVRMGEMSVSNDGVSERAGVSGLGRILGVASVAVWVLVDSLTTTAGVCERMTRRRSTLISPAR
jgi:hypothetical protein